jgi:hypothetical protein
MKQPSKTRTRERQACGWKPSLFVQEKVVVFKLPPVDSPEMAVKLAIAAKARGY